MPVHDSLLIDNSSQVCGIAQITAYHLMYTWLLTDTMSAYQLCYTSTWFVTFWLNCTTYSVP